MIVDKSVTHARYRRMCRSDPHVRDLGPESDTSMLDAVEHSIVWRIRGAASDLGSIIPNVMSAPPAPRQGGKGTGSGAKRSLLKG